MCVEGGVLPQRGLGGKLGDGDLGVGWVTEETPIVCR